jgi:hypothetical protein
MILIGVFQSSANRPHGASAAAERVIRIILVLEPAPMNKAIAIIALEPSVTATLRYYRFTRFSPVSHIAIPMRYARCALGSATLRRRW